MSKEGGKRKERKEEGKNRRKEGIMGKKKITGSHFYVAFEILEHTYSPRSVTGK